MGALFVWPSWRASLFGSRAGDGVYLFPVLIPTLGRKPRARHARGPQHVPKLKYLARKAAILPSGAQHRLHNRGDGIKARPWAAITGQKLMAYGQSPFWAYYSAISDCPASPAATPVSTYSSSLAGI